LIGRGSFANVYEATSSKDDITWAVKVIPRELIKRYECEESFMTEVSIMKEINHPNIVHAQSFITTKTNYYIVMKIANNGDLANYMITHGYHFFDEKTAVFFLKQIACAFQQLRKHQIIHRDFK